MGIRSQEIWLVRHRVFCEFATGSPRSSLMVAYVEGFAPMVNSVPVFLHLTMSRASVQAAELLRNIWDDELGVSGTRPHPVLFDEVHREITQRYGRCLLAQRYGVAAAVEMVELCGEGDWPVGVAAMKAHESQFPEAYGAILAMMSGALGSGAEFFEVHSVADVEHTELGRRLIDLGIESGVVSEDEMENTFRRSTDILRGLMDSVWTCAES